MSRVIIIMLISRLRLGYLNYVILYLYSYSFTLTRKSLGYKAQVVDLYNTLVKYTCKPTTESKN